MDPGEHVRAPLVTCLHDLPHPMSAKLKMGRPQEPVLTRRISTQINTSASSLGGVAAILGTIVGVATLSGAGLVLVRIIKVSHYNSDVAGIIISSTSISNFFGILGLELLLKLPLILALVGMWMLIYGISHKYTLIKAWSIRLRPKLRKTCTFTD